MAPAASVRLRSFTVELNGALFHFAEDEISDATRTFRSEFCNQSE